MPTLQGMTTSQGEHSLTGPDRLDRLRLLTSRVTVAAGDMAAAVLSIASVAGVTWRGNAADAFADAVARHVREARDATAEVEHLAAALTQIVQYVGLAAPLGGDPGVG